MVAPRCVCLPVAEEMATLKEKLPLSSGFQRLPSTLVPCQAGFSRTIFNISFISNCLLHSALNSPFRTEVVFPEVPPPAWKSFPGTCLGFLRPGCVGLQGRGLGLQKEGNQGSQHLGKGFIQEKHQVMS